MPLSERVSPADKMVYFCNAFLSDLPDPFKIIDDHFRIVWGNRKNAEVHQIRQENVVGEICYDIFYKKHSPCSPCAAKMARKSGKPYTVTKKCTLSNGDRVWCDQRAVPLFDHNQDPAFFLVYGIVVTDVKFNLEPNNCAYFIQAHDLIPAFLHESTKRG